MIVSDYILITEIEKSAPEILFIDTAWPGGESCLVSRYQFFLWEELGDSSIRELHQK